MSRPGRVLETHPGRAPGAPAPEPLRQARVQQRRRQPQRLIEQIQSKRRANRHSSDISIVNVVADYDSYRVDYAAGAVAGEQEAFAQGSGAICLTCQLVIEEGLASTSRR